MDRLLTAEQTADHFQVHPKTINAWVAKGILAATDIGGGGVCKPCRSTRTNQTRKERRHVAAGLEAASTSANSQRPAARG